MDELNLKFKCDSKEALDELERKIRQAICDIHYDDGHVIIVTHNKG